MTRVDRSSAGLNYRLKTASLAAGVAFAFLAMSTGLVSAAETANLVGRQVTAFSAKDFRGRTHSLDEYSSSRVVVLAFLGTECPLAKLYGPRLASISKQYADKGVTVLGVNSNRHDSITEISAYARIHEIGFPILKDLDNRIADQVGATRTPEILILDEKRVVRYHGRVDDQYGDASSVASERPIRRVRSPFRIKSRESSISIASSVIVRVRLRRFR